MKLSEFKDRRIKAVYFDGTTYTITLHAEDPKAPAQKPKDPMPECSIICKPQGAPSGTKLYIECEHEKVHVSKVREAVEY